MPELPEVETITLGLDYYLNNKTIASVSADVPKIFPNSPSLVDGFMLGHTIQAVHRRGKAILISLSSGYHLVVHLKMTGQLIYLDQTTRPLIDQALPNRFTHVIIGFADGSQLFYNDQRKFGWLKLMSASELSGLPFLNKMGPEPLSRHFTRVYFKQALSGRKSSSIKAALLDQTVVAGIGNIYADESLFVAGIDPRRPAVSLTDQERNRLHRAIRQVLNTAIAVGGSSRYSYINAIGQKGGYLNQAYVYARQEQPCQKCGRPIEKIRVAGRGTHYCRHCQK